jgi:hypothetical protein
MAPTSWMRRCEASGSSRHRRPATGPARPSPVAGHRCRPESGDRPSAPPHHKPPLSSDCSGGGGIAGIESGLRLITRARSASCAALARPAEKLARSESASASPRRRAACRRWRSAGPSQPWAVRSGNSRCPRIGHQHALADRSMVPLALSINMALALASTRTHSGMPQVCAGAVVPSLA